MPCCCSHKSTSPAASGGGWRNNTRPSQTSQKFSPHHQGARDSRHYRFGGVREEQTDRGGNHRYCNSRCCRLCTQTLSDKASDVQENRGGTIGKSPAVGRGGSLVNSPIDQELRETLLLLSMLYVKGDVCLRRNSKTLVKKYCSTLE